MKYKEIKTSNLKEVRTVSFKEITNNSQKEVINSSLKEIRTSSINYDGFISDYKDSLIKEEITISEIVKNASNNKDKLKTATKILISTVVGIGSAFAMMPIMTNELIDLKYIGIDVHGDTIFTVETINTGLVFFTLSSFSTYKALNTTNIFPCLREEYRSHDISGIDKIKKYINDDSIIMKKKIVDTAVVLASSVIPVSLLWKVELSNKNIADTDGFDVYMQYATACTFPIVIASIANSLNHTSIKSFDYKLLDCKRVASIALSLLGSVGRYYSFVEIFKELFEETKVVNENVTDVVSIIAGGVICNAVETILSISNLDSLFRADLSKLTKTEIASRVFFTLEGAWFSLPAISNGVFGMEQDSKIASYVFNSVFFTNELVHQTNKFIDVSSHIMYNDIAGEHNSLDVSLQ